VGGGLRAVYVWVNGFEDMGELESIRRAVGGKRE
jgi:hypothetical protein